MYWGIDTCGWALMRCCQASTHVCTYESVLSLYLHSLTAGNDWRGNWLGV